MSHEQQNSLLGVGRGIDHIAIATHDLEAARLLYAETLGFARPQNTRLPHGVDNSIIWFADSSYLELFAFYDREKAGIVAAFVGEQEGGMFYALDVTSVADTVAFLRQRGFEVTDPIGGTTAVAGMTEPPPELWQYVMFVKPVVPANAVFFIQYHAQVLRELSEKYPAFNPLANVTHANTAKGIKSVWMAVKDGEAAANAYASIGLPPGKSFAMPQLGAVGREIEVGSGTILLLASDGANGMTASFLAHRGDGLIGMSIEVAELDTAVQFIEANAAVHLEDYSGLYGQSVLVPTELTNGISMELFQKS